MAKELDDRLDELERQLADNKNKAIRKMNEELVNKEQEAEDLRIKTKKLQNKNLVSSQEQEYNQSVEEFQGMVFDLMGDLNDLLLLAHRGKIGRTNINALTQIQNKLIAYKKDLGTKLIAVKPLDRQSFLFLNKKINNVMKNVIIPSITKDDAKKERLKGKL